VEIRCASETLYYPVIYRSTQPCSNALGKRLIDGRGHEFEGMKTNFKVPPSNQGRRPS